MKTLRIFEPRQHYLTTVFRDGKRNARRIRVKSVEQLERLVDQQPNNTDLYITKYAKDDIVWNIVLDFDSEDDKGVAYNDVMTLRRFLAKKGINVVVVDSTNKGFHCYIEIPPTNFRKFGDDLIEEGASSLITLRNKIVEKSDEKAPSFLLVLTAVGGAYKREDGVFVAPINLLKG